MSISTVTPLVTRDFSVMEIALDGVAGLSDSSALRKTLKQSLRQGYKAVLVDLKSVVDVDRSCWNCLVSTARQLRRDGGVVILWHCPLILFTQLQSFGWDRCFLMPEHHPEDMAAMPPLLRVWVAADGEQAAASSS